MLKHRLLSSTILIAALVALVYFDARHAPPQAGGAFLLPALWFFAFGTSWDWCQLLRAAGRPVRRGVLFAATLLCVTLCAAPVAWPLVGMTYPPDCPIGAIGWSVIAALVAIGMSVVWELGSYRQSPSHALDHIVHHGFAITFIAIPLGFYVLLRQLGSDGFGLAATLTLIAATKAADTGAYTFGKLIGRNKLIPHVSPGKTWEGLLGGILFSVAASAACLYWLFPACTGIQAIANLWAPAMGLGVLATLAGLIGDLTESLVKRELGAKDSGSLLPGLGGVWDVTDSLLATSVPGYLFFVTGCAGSPG
jgi:phosphatidate cytidylyltransferase